MPWDFILILLFLGLAIPWRGLVRMNRFLRKSEITPSDRLSLYGSTILFQWLIAGVVAWRTASRGLNYKELGLAAAPSAQILWATVVLTLLMCLTQVAAFRQMARLPGGSRGHLFAIAEKMMPRSHVEICIYAALACTAGLAEEFLYRGFVFAVAARVGSNFHFPAAAPEVLSAALFSLAHLYQGPRGLMTTFIVGIIFAAVRGQTGSLIPAAVAHIGVDLVAGLYLARLVRNG